MIEMLTKLENHIAQSDKTLHLLGDSAYTALAILAHLPESIQVTGRIPADARLHEPAPQSQPGRRGRPRVRGVRLPAPQDLLQAKGLRRVALNFYENTTQHVRLAHMQGCLYRVPGRLVQVVIIEHLKGGRGIETFYSTVVDHEPIAVLQQYSWRWPIEVTFHDVKQHLGINQPQNRKIEASHRTAATGFLLYSLIIWWHETKSPQPIRLLRSWRGKRHPSFADMLAGLRSETLQSMMKTNLSTPDIPPNVRKYINHLTRLIELAA